MSFTARFEDRWERDMPESADDHSENVLSILTPAEIGALGGLPREAIIGVFRDEAFSLDRFRSNPGFLRYLHEVIRTAGPSDLAFEVAQGRLIEASYWGNEAYQAHTRAGTIKLPPGLRHAFFRMLEASRR